MFPPPLCFLINLLLCFLISSSFTSFPVSSPSSSSLFVVFLSSLLSIPVYFLSSPSFLPSFRVFLFLSFLPFILPSSFLLSSFHFHFYSLIFTLLCFIFSSFHPCWFPLSSLSCSLLLFFFPLILPFPSSRPSLHFLFSSCIHSDLVTAATVV